MAKEIGLLELTVLERIVEYQLRNRQVGHTDLMLDGAIHHKQPLIVVGTFAQRDWLADKLRHKMELNIEETRRMVLTVNQIEMGVLDGLNGRPLVIDNVGLFYLATDVDEKRRKLLMQRFGEAEVGRG